MSYMELSLQFRILNEEDYDEVLKLVQEEFVPREPASCALRLSAEEGRVFAEEIIKKAVSQHVSLGAFDKRTNNLIAVRLNLLGKLADSHELVVGNDVPLKVKQIRECMKAILCNDISECMGTKDYMQFVILCSHSDYSNKGIGTEMCKRLEDIARREGCKKIFTIASSFYTKRITKKLGYETQVEVTFKEYVDVITKDHIFAHVAEPHKSMALVVKTL